MPWQQPVFVNISLMLREQFAMFSEEGMTPPWLGVILS